MLDQRPLVKQQFCRPFSIPNLAVARCDSGKALQIRDTPFLQATTFEHEHEHEHERRTPNAKRLVRAVRFFYPYLGLKPQAESYYPFGISPTSPAEARPRSAPLIIRSPQKIRGADTRDQGAGGESDQIRGDKPKIGAVHVHTPESATEMG